MTFTNDLLPFGTGVGANVLDQASYAALAGRTAGFTAGTAISAQLNKVWRQSTFGTAMVGQFTADYGTANVVDDGNVTNFETNFKSALNNFIGLSFVQMINTAVTKTVHGTSPDFPDLFAAMAWLAQRRIVPGAGSVTFNVRAGQFSYGTQTLYIQHPDLAYVSIVGANLSGSVPIASNFTTTGNGTTARSNDFTTNIAVLRGKFTTELQFTGSGGVVVQGGIGLFDKILISGSGSTTHLLYHPQGWSNFGIVAIAGAGLNGLWVASSRINQTTGGCLIAIGCGQNGIFAQANGSIFTTSSILSFGNAGDGVQARTGSTVDAGTGAVVSSCKGNAGYGFHAYDTSSIRLPNGAFASTNGTGGLYAHECSSIFAQVITISGNTGGGAFASGSSRIDVQTSPISGNSTWGCSADSTSTVDARNCGFATNTSGAATASFQSTVLITGATGTTGLVSPTVNTAGNGNAYIYQ